MKKWELLVYDDEDLFLKNLEKLTNDGFELIKFEIKIPNDCEGFWSYVALLKRETT